MPADPPPDAATLPVEATPNPAASTADPAAGAGPSAPSLPVTIGRYTVRDLLARGGMGEVYLAHDRHLSRDVALKVVRPEMALHERTVQRFLEESQITGQLQ